jgi:hypothetical protein
MAIYLVSKAINDTDIEYGGAGVGAAGAAGATGAALYARQHGRAAAGIRAAMPKAKRTWKVWQQPKNLGAAQQAIKDISHHEAARVHGKLGAVTAATIGVAGGATGAYTAWHKSHPSGEAVGMAKSAFGVEDDRISKSAAGDLVRPLTRPARVAGRKARVLGRSAAAELRGGGKHRQVPNAIRGAARDARAMPGRVGRVANATVRGEEAAGRMETPGDAARAAGYAGRQILRVPGVKPALYTAGGATAAAGGAGGYAAYRNRQVKKGVAGDLLKPLAGKVSAAGDPLKAKAKAIIPTLRQMPGRLGATTNAYVGGAKAAGQLNTAGDSLRTMGGLASQYTKVPGVKPVLYGAGGAGLVGGGAAYGASRRNNS